MKVIVVKRKNLLDVVQVMKKWMAKVEMNLIIQIMKVVNKIKSEFSTTTKKKKNTNFLCFLFSFAH